MSRDEYTSELNFFGSAAPEELARAYGTPLYVYNEELLRRRCRDLRGLSGNPAFGVNYSVKANSNPFLLKIVREEGLRVDAMSPGELYMDRLAGYSPSEILYISNNISVGEMRAALDAGCLISVDSLSQLDTLGRLAPGGEAMIRINPGIGEGHSAKVVTGGSGTKFGINSDQTDRVLALLERRGLRLAGLNQHIGSLFMSSEKYLAAASVLLDYAASLPPSIFKTLKIIDFGGGFGIPYHKYERQDRLDLAALSRGLNSLMGQWQASSGYAGKFLIEPGRYVMAECGLLLGEITAVKNNGRTRFAGSDLGFNVLQRPVMYDAFHDIEIYAGDLKSRPVMRQTIVGDICESGDMLAKDRDLPELREGDLIGVLDAGAYGFSMASNYNERLLPAEILIAADGQPRLIRRRQTLEELASNLPI